LQINFPGEQRIGVAQVKLPVQVEPLSEQDLQILQQFLPISR
jgi:hypothetical protein